jgi:hypothetical protein
MAWVAVGIQGTPVQVGIGMVAKISVWVLIGKGVSMSVPVEATSVIGAGFFTSFEQLNKKNAKKLRKETLRMRVFQYIFISFFSLHNEHGHKTRIWLADSTYSGIGASAGGGGNNSNNQNPNKA